MDSKQLYQEVILDHNRKPRNWGKLEDATHRSEGLNPLCGDHIWVALKVDGDRIEKVAFEGESCAICKASASMMTTAVKGKTTAEAGPPEQPHPSGGSLFPLPASVGWVGSVPLSEPHSVQPASEGAYGS